ncbi:MAG TPA: hypothetical protein VMV49_10530 [Candidatus Deferrimicrobium sp.]|nr:hypothetical protein [Candidatus Deferrimicrobium sp.]
MIQLDETNPEIIEILCTLTINYPNKSLDEIFQEIFYEIEKSVLDSILQINLPKPKPNAQLLKENKQYYRMPKKIKLALKKEREIEKKIRIFRIIQSYYKSIEDTSITFDLGKMLERDGSEFIPKSSKLFDYDPSDFESEIKAVSPINQINPPIFSGISLQTSPSIIEEISFSQALFPSIKFDDDFQEQDWEIKKDFKGKQINEERFIKEISDISTKLMSSIVIDEKIQLIVQLNNILKENKYLIKKKYPDLLVSILDSL